MSKRKNRDIVIQLDKNRTKSDKCKNCENWDFCLGDSFHSFDLYLPILIIEKIFIPTVIGLLTSYIYDKIRGYEDQKPMVKSKLILKEGDTQLELSYEGDAETFCKTLLELREMGKI